MGRHDMIRHEFCIKKYWKVIVYYNVDYDFFNLIRTELLQYATDDNIKYIYSMMHSGKAKAVTYSNLHEHISFVLFNLHESKADYISSIVHEAEHVKQAILSAYDVNDAGEDAAYTIGYIVKRMFSVFKKVVCSDNL